MNTEQFERERRYQATMSVARTMLRQGLVTEDEFQAIDTMLLEKYKPLLGSLYAENLEAGFEKASV